MPNPSHETKFPGGNREREILISPVQPTTSRTGNLTPVDPPRALYDNMHTYILGTYLVHFTVYCRYYTGNAFAPAIT